jgi:DNA repair protein RecO (recombination protein O)
VRRIVRAEAICLRVRDYSESSKLVTFFTLAHGKVGCLAKGARRLRSKFGAALDIFAQSRIIYYSHETRTLLTLSDAELVRSYSGLAAEPEKFLAAEQMAEFVLRVIQPLDPSPQLYQLLLNYLSTLESVASPPSSLLPPPYPALVCSFLLKAASFLGFRPELRRCLICRRPIENQRPAYFDPARGGIICPRCSGERGEMTRAGHDRENGDCPAPSRTQALQGTVPRFPHRVPSLKERSEGLLPVFPTLTRLDPASLDLLCFLLYTPASDIASLAASLVPRPSPLIPTLDSPLPLLDLVLGFLGHHFDPLVLNSFRWHAGLERNS